MRCDVPTQLHTRLRPPPRHASGCGAACRVSLPFVCTSQFFFFAAPGDGTTVSAGQAKGYLGRVEAACLLEAAMSCSPYNHNLKVCFSVFCPRSGTRPSLLFIVFSSGGSNGFERALFFCSFFYNFFNFLPFLVVLLREKLPRDKTRLTPPPPLPRALLAYSASGRPGCIAEHLLYTARLYSCRCSLSKA